MAKAKKEPIEEIKAEEVMVESVEEETAEPLRDDPRERFIIAQLKVINRMTDRAKAKRCAERVLSNRKG